MFCIAWCGSSIRLIGDIYCGCGARCRISTSMAGQVEKDRLDQETLDIKSLQLLRGLVHNEIVKLPDNWQPGVSTTCM